MVSASAGETSSAVIRGSTANSESVFLGRSGLTSTMVEVASWAHAYLDL
jgi:hypothetical protein